MDIKTKYGWQEIYANALLETDWSKIKEKIKAAEDGIKVKIARVLFEPRRHARRKPSHRGCSARTRYSAERSCRMARIAAGRLGNSVRLRLSSCRYSNSG